MMRGFGWMAVAMMALSACGGGSGGKEKIADKVEDRADDRADAMDAAAQNIANPLQQNIANSQAELVRDAGKERADAIRNSQLEANQLTDNQKNALINGSEMGTPAKIPR